MLLCFPRLYKRNELIAIFVNILTAVSDVACASASRAAVTFVSLSETCYKPVFSLTAEAESLLVTITEPETKGDKVRSPSVGCLCAVCMPAAARSRASTAHFCRGTAHQQTATAALNR